MFLTPKSLLCEEKLNVINVVMNVVFVGASVGLLFYIVRKSRCFEFVSHLYNETMRFVEGA